MQDGPEIEVHTNGNNSYSAPALEDIAIQQLGQKEDAIRDMMSGSVEVEKWLPRSVLTGQELKAYTRFISDHDFMETGDPSVENMLWYNIIGSVAINGRARDEVVTMYTGRRNLLQQVGDMVSSPFRSRRRQGPNSNDMRGG